MFRKLFFLLILANVLPRIACSMQNPGFYENKGQWPDSVLFGAPLDGGRLYITEQGFIFDLYSTQTAHHGQDSSGIDFRHSYYQYFPHLTFNRDNFQGEAQFHASFFKGNNPENWGKGCAVFPSLRFTEIAPGLDLYVQLNGGQIKTDWLETAPGSMQYLQWVYQGISNPVIEDGALLFRSADQQWIEKIPGAFRWESAQDTVRFDCSFSEENGLYSFNTPIDDGHCYWVDPELIFSTYSGSVSNNFGFTATYDLQGFLYGGSIAMGPNFPLEMAYDDTFNSDDTDSDIAITKYDTTGTKLIYSTFIGGNSGEAPHSIVCNAKGELFALGTTGSQDCPTSPGAIQNNLIPSGSYTVTNAAMYYDHGVDLYLFGLGVNGDQLLGATYLGGARSDGVVTQSKLAENYADIFRGEIDLDANGNLIVATTTGSFDFPTTPGAYQNSYPGAGLSDLQGILFRVSPDFRTLMNSTYFSGDSDNAIFSLDTDSDGNIYVAGGTDSQDLIPLSKARFQKFLASSNEIDAYIAVFDPELKTLLRGSYFGGPEYDQAYFIELDKNEDVYILGQTLNFNDSKFNQNSAINQSETGGSLFAAKLNNALSGIEWSLNLGDGVDHIQLSPTAFLVDLCFNVYISGWGGGVNFLTGIRSKGYVEGFPITPDAFKTDTDGSDFYLTAVNGDASDIIFGTYFGGNQVRDQLHGEHVDGGTNRLDPRGKLYQTLCASCFEDPDATDFPIFPPDAWASKKGSGENQCNSSVFKFDFNLPITVVDFELDPVQCANTPIQPTNLTSGGIDYEWDLGNGVTSTEFEPLFFYPTPGEYTITLVGRNMNTCNGIDSISKTVVVLDSVPHINPMVLDCSQDSLTIGDDLPIFTGVSYEWFPKTGIEAPFSPKTRVAPGNQTYYLVTQYGTCSDTAFFPVLTELPPLTSSLLVACDPDSPEELLANSQGLADRFTWFKEDTANTPINFGPRDSSVFVLVEESTTYIVWAEVGNCSRLDTVWASTPANDHFLMADQQVCQDDTTQIEPGEPYPGYTYVWDYHPSVVSTNLQNRTLLVSPNIKTEYGAWVSTPDGCLFRDSITIDISNVDEIDFEIQSSVSPPIVNTAMTFQLVPQLDVDVQWEPAEFFNPPYGNTVQGYFTTSDTIWVHVLVKEGQCEQEIAFKLNAKEVICGPPNLFLPNAFSPNGDGENDVLFLRGNYITEMSLQIFDRWGNMVFESQDQSIGWDGRFQGVRVDPGVFVYQLYALCEGGETWSAKGNITVLR